MQAIRMKLALACTGRGNFGAVLQTMATRVSIFALNMASGITTARTLGAHGRGLLAALLTWPQLITFLLTLGVATSLLYNVKADPVRKGAFFAATLLVSGAASVLAVIVGILLVPHLLPGYPPEELQAARILMTTAPAIMLALMVQTAAEAAGDFPGANTLRGISVLGTFAGVFALAVTHTMSPVAAAICYLLPQLPLTIWLLHRLAPTYRLSLGGVRQVLPRLMKYAVRCYPMELLNTALTYVGQAMVVALLEPTAVGYFAVSLGVARLLEIFYTAVATVLLPATAARSATEVIEKTGRAARLTLLLMAVLAVVLFLMLPVLVPLVYGSGFSDVVVIARILVIEGVVSGTVWILAMAFVALGRPELPTVVQISTLVLSTTMLLLWVPTYGARGAAEVLLAVAVAKLLLVGALYRFGLKVPLRQLLYCRGDFIYARELWLR